MNSPFSDIGSFLVREWYKLDDEDIVGIFALLHSRPWILGVYATTILKIFRSVYWMLYIYIYIKVDLSIKKHTCDLDVLKLIPINEESSVDLKYLMIFYPVAFFFEF